MLSYMKERLQTLLNLEKLTAAQLASLLEIQRSTLSNILGGRNKPSYDLILSILTKLPNLNIEWLLEGKGRPYKDSEKNFRGDSIEDEKNSGRPAEVRNPASGSTDLFGFEEAEQFSDFPEEDENYSGSKISEKSDNDNQLHAGLSENSGNDTATFIFRENNDSPAQSSDMVPATGRENGGKSEDSLHTKEYHPFPPLEKENIEQQLKALQSSVNKQVTGKNTTRQPSENRVFGKNLPDARQNKKLIKVVLCYSDGSFEDFTR